jgi:DnaJ like chaperone protein
MRWQGKVVGTLIGLVGGPVGAIVGFMLGHGYDLSQEQLALEGRTRTRGPSAHEIGEIFFRTTFTTMGHLAKSDGRVSEAEIGAARAVMQALHLPPDAVAVAIRYFTEGKAPDYPVEADIDRLAQACVGHGELLRFFLELQVRAALAGNDLQGVVRTRLLELAQRLGVGGLEVVRIEAAVRMQQQQQRPGAQGRSQRGAEGAASADRLQAAYETLGVERTATDGDVKRAYRRLMNQNHPDKLVARGLPESMLELAKEKTQRIREAYEIISAARGLR